MKVHDAALDERARQLYERDRAGLVHVTRSAEARRPSAEDVAELRRLLEERLAANGRARVGAR